MEDASSCVRLVDGGAKVHNMHIDWTVDFFQGVLRGAVVLQAQAISSGPVTLTLDTKDLDIDRVLVDGVAVPFQMDADAASDALGTPMRIPLPTDAAAAGQNYFVTVSYSTRPSASALQWLAPRQTSSGAFPYLFSQCQAIHARSMMPCQDMNQAKMTYTATVRYPAQLTALMSAVTIPTLPAMHAVPQSPAHPVPELPPVLAPGGWAVKHFQQQVPIPAYLVAVVVGELESRRIGPRCSVWAEPSVVDKAAWEFADTEKMIDIAEARCGPYRWGVFDLLVLPPSFPYGGMENPNLTFVTPTLLAGDRSQVAVIAHELAHSWSGNLVTNATWDHFWINEGLTVFTETKIVEALFGAEAASIRMEEGWQHVKGDVDRVGATHRFTCLCPKLARGQDPDDAFSSVPYEKGSALFWLLESMVGAAAMTDTLRHYFDAFAFQTITSEQLQTFFVDRHPALATAIEWDAWFHAPGMPSYKPPHDEAPIEEAKALADAWRCVTEEAQLAALEAKAPAFVQWPSSKKCVFSNTLATAQGAEAPALTFAKAARMATAYQLLSSNAEIRCALIGLWLPLAGSKEAAAVPIDAARQLVGEQGRMKFVRPTYRSWFAVDPDGARSTFQANRASYHPICAKMLAKDLQL